MFGTILGEANTLTGSNQVFVGGTGDDSISVSSYTPGFSLDNPASGEALSAFAARVIDGGGGSNSITYAMTGNLSVLIENLIRSDLPDPKDFVGASLWRLQVSVSDAPEANDYDVNFHPDVFCAALLNSQPMGFYAPAQVVPDAREHGIEVRPVCSGGRNSGYRWTANDQSSHPRLPITDGASALKRKHATI